jgi:Fur family ferric uptake transcriptional regulator
MLTYTGEVKKTLSLESAQILLRRAGLRATSQRVALLQNLARTDGPVSVERLTKSAEGAYDIATAYRILDALVTSQLVHRIELAQGKALYEIAGDHHHHAVCRSCGLIKDIHACLPEGIDARVQQTSGFARIEHHALEFFGVCKPCSKK